MNNNNQNLNSLRIYLKIIGIFFVISALSLLIFFHAIEYKIDEKVITAIITNVNRQSAHLNSIINLQFQYLEGLSTHIAQQNELICDENMALIRSLYTTNVLERVTIIDPDGNSHHNNGEIINLSDRSYFIESMQGKNILSNPLESRVDQESRVILSVPIRKDDTVIGVLAGSCNIASLNQLLFEDVYGGNGYSLIVSQEGQTISLNGNTDLHAFTEDDNFLEYYATIPTSRDRSRLSIFQDFLYQQTGAAKMNMPDGIQYLSYAPLDINGWMLCCIVNQDAAAEPYCFIEDYELVLIEILAVEFLLLILFIYRTNRHRQKALLLYARTDALTGIFNKQYTEAIIDQWLSDYACNGIQAFLMMDIDKFKGINAHHGHICGDEVLRQVGHTLKFYFRDGDIVGRIGGDEFVILMKNLNSKKAAIAKTESLCALIRQLEINNYPEIHFTISIGLAFAPRHGTSFKELYQHADRALYETKQRGRDGYTFYDETAKP